MIKDTNSYHIGVIRHFQQLEGGFQKSKVVKLGVCSAARRGVVQVCDKVIRKIKANNADFKTLHFHSLVKKIIIRRRIMFPL